LNRSGDSGHPCLVPDFRGNGFSFSPLSIMLAVGLSSIAFIILRYFPSIPSSLRAQHKSCLSLCTLCEVSCGKGSHSIDN
jgi:hypothetical protein